MRVGDAGGPLNVGLGHTRRTEGDVVRHGIVEQDAVLCDDAHQCAQVTDAEVAEVVPVDEHRPAGDVEEAGEQIRERGLATAAGAHEGHAGPLGDGDADVLQHGGAFGSVPACGGGVVREGHVAVFDVLFEARDGFRGGLLLHGVLHGKQVEDALAAGTAAGDGGPTLGEALDGR